MKTLKCLLLSILIVNQLRSQVAVGTYVNPIARLDIISTDTVTLARNCAYNKDFQTADWLLTDYNANRVDFHGLSLHAQVIYWMQSFDRSMALYEKALGLFPQPSSLNLDYARLLFSLGRLADTRKQLNIYRLVDSTNAEAEIMTTYLDLWMGRIGSARKGAGSLLQKYPDNPQAKDIVNTINQWTVPYMKGGIQFLSDDQPLKGQSYYAEAGVYRSWLFAPTIQTAIYQFKAADTSYHSSWVQLSNSFQLGTKNKVKLKGGIFGQNGKQSEFTGSAEVSQQIGRHFSLQAAMERRPYQYTISSIKNVVMENASVVGLNYNRKDKWYGRLAYEGYKYGDDNKINVAYLWILAPVFSHKYFSFSAGYAFRYADARTSTYESKQTISEVIANWPPVNGIPGIYNPYFTPENQQAHSALASLKINASKKLRFSSTINIAFSAKADNPYLYLDTHDTGLFFNSGFAPIEYTPTSWMNEISLAASKKFYVTVSHNYDKLLFYKSNRGSIELKYLFSK